MTGKEKDKESGDTFVVGFLFAIFVVLVAYICIGVIFDSKPCDAGRELLEEAQIRIMVENELSSLNDVCRFATDEGFVLYHDGILFFEAADDG